MKAPARFGLLVAATAAVALFGYLGYLVYPRFDLPASTGIGLTALAAAAGIASFFSPCSFPLLLAVLGRAPGVAERDGGLRPTLGSGVALAAGAATFLVLAGLVIAAVGGALFSGVTFTSVAGRAIRGVVGALLIVLGLVQTNALPNPFRRWEPAVHGALKRQAGLRRRRPWPGSFVFGFVYVLAGFG